MLDSVERVWSTANVVRSGVVKRNALEHGSGFGHDCHGMNHEAVINVEKEGLSLGGVKKKGVEVTQLLGGGEVVVKVRGVCE